MHAQFSVIPSGSKVASFFLLLTGQSMVPGAIWYSWNNVDNAAFELFRDYIRPSHHALLNAVISGDAANPCAFLRQLLRPHKLNIHASDGKWTLCTISSNRPPKVVQHRKTDVTVEWN
jgi:hypothetical protein